MPPSHHALAGKIGAYTLHAAYDSREITAPARQAFLAKFEAQVDPERLLPEAERKRRAEAARKAYFARLALKSAQARTRRKAISRRVPTFGRVA